MSTKRVGWKLGVLSMRGDPWGAYAKEQSGASRIWDKTEETGKVG